MCILHLRNLSSHAKNIQNFKCNLNIKVINYGMRRILDKSLKKKKNVQKSSVITYRVLYFNI